MRSTAAALVVALLFQFQPALALLSPGAERDGVPARFAEALSIAEKSLDAGDLSLAIQSIERALERDPQAPAAWALRARWAEAAGDRDDLVYSLHTQLRLLIAQKAPKADVAAVRTRLESIDPLAKELLSLRDNFVKKLAPLAAQYEKDARPHSAIRVHQQILTLDPERTESLDAIQRISSAPDPSLAESAKPRDLLADVSQEWMREHDAKHSTWKDRAKLERENYVTQTDAGYEVLVRAAEAMEQMNAFYRRFFQYGTEEDKKSVSRIELRIFKNRDEYLKLGSSPAEWSGGQFTGGAVETFVGQGGFEEMVGTLFHEAAHQFVGLATNAVGWLNEGLASFFEGCRILANGTVIMNLPANHRLFPLAERMEKGWMTDAADGIDPKNPTGSEPEKAPTFRIVLENRYSWGPPWYAPTWGVVYFLYNFQDPADGRFVYRAAFREFINASGGKSGEGAVENFEKVVLANPSKRTPGVEASEDLRLPKKIEDLDAVWKDWLLRLRDEQAGRAKPDRPYLDWAKHAIARKDFGDAFEHFEKGLAATPDDVELLVAFADHLALRENDSDRASKLVTRALQVLEASKDAAPDEKRVKELEQRLAKWDPKRETLAKAVSDTVKTARSLVERYLAADLPLLTMDLSWRLGTALNAPDLLDLYADAARRTKKSIAIWKLAYNESDLEGWAGGSNNDTFEPYGALLRSRFGRYVEGSWDYRFLTLDKVTSGDFSMQADIAAAPGRNAFCGLVFGRKDGQSFHAVVFFPGGNGDEGVTVSGSIDLTSFFGSDSFKVWRHAPVKPTESDWHTFRLDVSGPIVDVWVDGELIASQEFGSVDALRGSFGLITGPGEAQFKNVRYLAREARDPAALIEREMRLADARAKSPDGRIGESWIGVVPPFPEVGKWVQGSRTSWDEAGPVPTLLVFWSRTQNEKIPMDAWLRHLAETHKDVGLDFICVTEPADTKDIADYLEKHPFPGAVATDLLMDYEGGIGRTLTKYSIDRFQYPRLLLLDVDHKVIWEGDPGFEVGKRWAPGTDSYLDAPLGDLIAKRRLKDLGRWRKDWAATGSPALRDGRFDAALPLMREARGMPREGVREVDEALSRLEAVEKAIDALDATAAKIVAAGAEPALDALLSFAVALERPIDAKKLRALKGQATGGTNAKAWEKAIALARKTRKELKPGGEAAAAKAVVAGLAGLTGELPKSLARDLEAAAQAGDAVAITRLLDAADRRPAAWLAAWL